MGKVSAKGAVITISGNNFSVYTESYEIEWAQDVIDVTGFSAGWRNFMGGIPVVGFTLTMFWDATVTTGVFPVLKAMMTGAATCSIVPESGGPSFSGTFMCDGIHPQGAASSGALMLGSVHFSASGVAVAGFASA